MVDFCYCLGIISPAAHDPYAFRCKVCVKDVSCAHQGERDLIRHVGGKGHIRKLRANSNVNPISEVYVKQDSAADELARRAAVKFTGILAEYNLPLAAADHLGSLIRASFPDSKIAEAYCCARTKASCIVNDAVAPDLLKSLVADMKVNVFALSVDGSNE